MGRQYQEGEDMLRRAILLQPNWSAPHTELGLVLMQAGDEEAAREELVIATRLDPFNQRAANDLKLLKELSRYRHIETPHFVISYSVPKEGPAIDEVLARDMPPVLERIYRDITDIYQHRPTQKTHIQIMPDDKAFAVRITGMPWIWTIGACTGNVIAITPPRSGQDQKGPYDWPRVIRHEFTHTVTLDQTANRIPHWFTEACAVSQEPGGGRDYDTCRMLALAIQENKLFAIDQINWAFIRPKTPRDRPLAYAQAEWMLEYITTTYSHDAILKMLDLYRQGVGDEQAIDQVTGGNAASFMAGFKSWGREQINRWGLTPQPADPAIASVLIGGRPDPEKLAAALAKHPKDPDLLQAAAEQAIAHDDPTAAYEAVIRYASARPVDPWSDRASVALATHSGHAAEAVGALLELDQTEQTTGDWARQLAQIYRAQGQLDQASAAAERALQREPYNASLRELAATIDLQCKDLPGAAMQIEDMTILEPTRAANFTRLAAIYDRLGRQAEAKTAAQKALELDAKAPVAKFLQ